MSSLRDNLEVKLKRYKEQCFSAAKKIVLEGDPEKVRQMDEFVRKVYTDEPSKMAEWEKLMERCEFTDDLLK